MFVVVIDLDCCHAQCFGGHVVVEQVLCDVQDVLVWDVDVRERVLEVVWIGFVVARLLRCDHLVEFDVELGVRAREQVVVAVGDDVEFEAPVESLERGGRVGERRLVVDCVGERVLVVGEFVVGGEPVVAVGDDLVVWQVLFCFQLGFERVVGGEQFVLVGGGVERFEDVCFLVDQCVVVVECQRIEGVVVYGGNLGV